MKIRWIFWLLVLGFIWLIITNLPGIEKLARTLLQGQWQWVAAAALAQVLYYITLTGTYQRAFAAVEVDSRIRDLLPVTFSALFINVVAPAANAGGTALFADDARRRGQSPTRTAAGTLLQLIVDFSAFAILLTLGMYYLFKSQNLQFYEIIAALILLCLTLGLSVTLLMGLWRPVWLQHLLEMVQKAIARIASHFKKSPWLDGNWAKHTADDYSSAALAMANHPERLLQALGVALFAHIIDLTSLYMVILAFYQPVSFGVLIAGYSMGILFWIVSITPQGIGVVEGMMTIIFTSLGIPPNISAVIALSFRGLTFWIPLLIGFILLNRTRSFGEARHSLAFDWSIRLAAVILAAMGAINVLSAVTPPLAERLALLQQYLPLTVRHGGHLTAALAGFALLLLARGLWRRKRAAWLLAIIALLISAAVHLIKGLDFEEAALALVIVAYLFFLRHHFHAASDIPSVKQGLRVFVFSLLFTLAYGTAGFYLLDQHYNFHYSFQTALQQTIIMFTNFYDPGLEPMSGFGRYFAASIYLVGMFTLGYSLLMLIRPVLLRSPASPAERRKAETIVKAYGRSSLARLTLMDDKNYHFTPGGSVIAYTVRNRVAIALGDPIGPLQDIPIAIQSYQKLCTRNDWIPAFYQTHAETFASYQSAGLQAMCVGQEAIIHLDRYSLEGRSNKPIRTAVNRLSRLSYRVEIFPPSIPDDLMAELRTISDEWLTSMHGSEKRFSLGWFDDDYISNCSIASVLDKNGKITAFANLVPEFQRNEITADLMRRRSTVEPGTMDFLCASLFDWSKKQGYDTFNMGLSALAGVGKSPEDPALERIMHFIFEHVNQFYNFKGLHEFKEKFHPEWSPRYLIYPDITSLGQIYWALVQANSGQQDSIFQVFGQRPRTIKG